MGPRVCGANTSAGKNPVALYTSIAVALNRIVPPKKASKLQSAYFFIKSNCGIPMRMAAVWRDKKIKEL